MKDEKIVMEEKSTKRVWMIVEDEPSLRMMLSAAMMLIWGVEPLTFDDGYDAMAWLDGVEAHQADAMLPELALLDIRMPGPQGPEIGERLRKLPATSKIAIVMMTAYRLNSDERESIVKMAQPQAMVSKPLPRLSDLKQTLEEAIASTHSGTLSPRVLDLDVANLATDAAQSASPPAVAAPTPPATSVESSSQIPPLPAPTPVDVTTTPSPPSSGATPPAASIIAPAPSPVVTRPLVPGNAQVPVSASSPTAPIPAGTPVATDMPTPAKTPSAIGMPTITFTGIPSSGPFDNLRGRVDNVSNYDDYRIAVYIKVKTGKAGWWMKPTRGSPSTSIASDGTWVCDITRGGEHESPVQITAFLIPAGYPPPRADGIASLPPKLFLCPYTNADR